MRITEIIGATAESQAGLCISSALCRLFAIKCTIGFFSYKDFTGYKKRFDSYVSVFMGLLSGSVKGSRAAKTVSYIRLI